MRTVLGFGSGTARFTTSKVPPGPLTCTAVICDMTGLLGLNDARSDEVRKAYSTEWVKGKRARRWRWRVI